MVIAVQQFDHRDRAGSEDFPDLKRLCKWRWLLLLACVLCSRFAMSQERLQIRTQSGNLHPIQVEVADTLEKRTRGLMGRTRLAENAGMLFLFEEPWNVQMWMKNTLIPLDMIFIARTGRIAHIHEQATPGSLQHIEAGVRVSGVLEMAGGSVRQLGITVGDQVLYEAFRAD